MMITTTDELVQVCTRFSLCPFVTIDTEFIREKTYYPQVCLIQIASLKEAFCIDPLAKDISLTPLFDLLQNKSVIKVFHACRQDIEIFYHLTGKVPVPVFDTQVGAMVCGYGDNVSYSQLVYDFLGVSLDKTMRVTDWSYRPLSKEQIQYALHDVVELRDVYTKMMARICETNRLDWLAEEMQTLVNPKTYQPDINQVWRRIKVPFKNPHVLHVFAKLCAWREEYAQAKDRPRKHILKDDALIELAVAHPTEITDMNRLRTLPDGFSKSELALVLANVIKQALADNPDTFEQPPQLKPLTQTERNAAELLRLVLGIVCDDHHVAPKLVASSEDLHTFIQTGNAPFMTGWRGRVFGEYASAVINGTLSIAYDTVSGKLVLRLK